MSAEFDDIRETELLELIQREFGLEVFTPGLGRTQELYRPFIESAKMRGTKVTIIAGTNGKGQTAHTLAHYLQRAGQSYALWTSPHILSLRERFRFDGQDVSYQELEEEITSAIEHLKSFESLKISFYEFLFLVFLRLYDKRSSSHLILEVGLGGRLDAVNHFDADLACITSISRDHQAILGNRFDLILSEKIAVSRRGKVLVTQFELHYLNELTRSYCQNKGIAWKPLPKPEKSLNYFEQNQRMAAELFYELTGDFPEERVGVPAFKGRREEMTFNGNTLIFIGAHNIDGVRSMTELYKSEAGADYPTQLLISFSKRPDSEMDVMMRSLVEHFGEHSKLFVTHFEHPKAADKMALLRCCEQINKINKGMLDFVTDWTIFLQQAHKQKILVCGSYYFVGEIQRLLHSHF